MSTKTIIHLDGDSFFASVEVASRPHLRGKPVITGGERGIATAISPEAKRLGVVRGMPSFQIKKLYPEVTILSSNFNNYIIYSERMMEIVRRHIAEVEPYSIDECFARDERPLEEVFEICKTIQEEIRIELGIGVSLGVSYSKVLAKVASKLNKPRGRALISTKNRDEILQKTLIGSVWGIGRSHTEELRNEDIDTALDFINLPKEWIYKNCHKPLRYIWHELRGESVMDLEADDTTFKSIMRSRTFERPSDKREVVWGELVHNIEAACSKSRKGKVAPSYIYFFLKTTEFRYHRKEFRLPSPTHDAASIIESVRPLFDKLFNTYLKSGMRYRSSGIILSSLVPDYLQNRDLFGFTIQDENRRLVTEAADRLRSRFGENIIHLASALPAVKEDGGIIPRPLIIPSLGKVK